MEIGRSYKLKVQKLEPLGARLEGRVLLPAKELPEGVKPGDELEVFLLKDNRDRLVATLKKPKAELGQLAVLPVVAMSKIGAFLDWGLDKDLFLPHSEQTRHIKEGDPVLVFISLDREGRPVATMKINDHFARPHDLKENDRVEAVVYSLHPELGAFVLVEGQYSGLLPRTKMKGAVRLGQKLTLRVEGVKADGKVDLSMFSRTYERLDADAHQIDQTLKANHGFLRVNDHTDPEKIQILFGMSKSQFKRALGRLLKEGQVEFYEDGIRRKEREEGKKEKGRK